MHMFGEKAKGAGETFVLDRFSHPRKFQTFFFNL